MTKRKGISKRVRFEIFKRDKFTCQYCGKKAPDVVLHIDHIHPVAEGGDGSMLNLTTACEGCNLGKSDVQLSDESAVVRQRTQLEALQERRDQIEMMLEWQRSLAGIEHDALDKAAGFWRGMAGWTSITPHGMHILRKALGRYGLDEVLTAMRTAGTQYFLYSEDGSLDMDSAVMAYLKIDGICATTRRMVDKPYLRDLYYIRKIAENNYSYFNKHEATGLLEAAFSWGADPDHLKGIVRSASSWSRWERDTTDYILELKERQGHGED